MAYYQQALSDKLLLDCIFLKKGKDADSVKVDDDDCAKL